MLRSDETVQPSFARRILSSVWTKMALSVVLVVSFSTLATFGTNQKVQEKQKEHLEAAVRQSAVQCYALEGSFPDNLSHLEEEYRLVIDHSNFAVYYESMGDNLVPQIKVIPLEHW